MNEENAKLARIKKSSSVGKKISNILAAILVVATIVLAVTGIVFLADKGSIESELSKAVASGAISEPSDKIGHVSAMSIELPDAKEIKTSIPALREALDARPYTIGYGIYMLTMSVVMVMAVVLLKIIASGFATIEKEANPFTDAVIKKVTIVMIIISVVMCFTVGAAFGGVGAIATWLIHSVMDYGRTLQIQSDETL